MSERVLILLSFTLLLVAGYFALRAWQARHLRLLQASSRAGSDAPLGSLVAGGPALLYFTTDTCAQCRFQQTPILQQLQAQVAAVSVITVDAVDRQELARHFGIMTVPSTVLLNDKHIPVAINHGLAPLQKLRTQVSTIL